MIFVQFVDVNLLNKQPENTCEILQNDKRNNAQYNVYSSMQ